ncbi:hypothetical protein PLICRDRAFT_424207 [Plicaturopsis crispa FD-325 SS-3]|nr:hypothetical protein PLICRDRAFT_424207 [Plicaturopsis crispa FD-325 SS-3]
MSIATDVPRLDDPRVEVSDFVTARSRPRRCVCPRKLCVAERHQVPAVYGHLTTQDNKKEAPAEIRSPHLHTSSSIKFHRWRLVLDILAASLLFVLLSPTDIRSRQCMRADLMSRHAASGDKAQRSSRGRKLARYWAIDPISSCSLRPSHGNNGGDDCNDWAGRKCGAKMHAIRRTLNVHGSIQCCSGLGARTLCMSPVTPGQNYQCSVHVYTGPTGRP